MKLHHKTKLLTYTSYAVFLAGIIVLGTVSIKIVIGLLALSAARVLVTIRSKYIAAEKLNKLTDEFLAELKKMRVETASQQEASPFPNIKLNSDNEEEL